jgi:hypothetical protein
MFGRIDYQDHNLRMAQKQMELYWNASPSLGDSASIWTAIFQVGSINCFDGDAEKGERQRQRQTGTEKQRYKETDTYIQPIFRTVTTLLPMASTSKRAAGVHPCKTMTVSRTTT